MNSYCKCISPSHVNKYTLCINNDIYYDFFLLPVIYRGCADEERWPRLDMTYTGCRYQDYMGWSGDHVLWCFCAQSNCNSPPIGEVTSSTRRTSVPQFDQNRNNRTSPVTSYTRFPIGGTSDDDGKGQRPNTRTTRGLTTTPTGRPMSTPRDKSKHSVHETLSAHYAHTDLSRITTELCGYPVLFTGGWRNNFTYDKGKHH